MAGEPDAAAARLGCFVSETVAAGSVVYTDRRKGGSGLGAIGFLHQPTSLAASGDPAHVAMPRAHRLSSLLKRWLLGSHQGATRPHQLDFYLDEFAFRFNRRRPRRRGLLFYRLLQQAMQVDPVPLNQLVGGHG